MKRSILLVLGVILMSLSPRVQATEGGFGAYLPGYRDFLTGIVPPKPGLYFRNDFYFYDAGVSRTVRQGAVNLNVDIFLFADIIQPTFVFPGDIFGAKFAMGAALPIMDTHLSGSLATASGTLAAKGEQLAQGDFIINPFILGWNHKKFFWNFTTAFFIPTGKYDVNNVINSGKNYVTIDPELGFTYFDMMRGIDVSLALGYSVNFENQATQYESGDAFHADFAAEKIFRFGLKAGVVGYAWVQTNGDSGAGAILGPFKGRIFGAGPALGYNFKIGEHTLGTMFKYYREFGAKNHFQGNAFDLALTFDI